jgi:WD40 repeat protein
MKVLIVIALFSFGYAFGQEVKLGLPVGHSASVRSAIFSPDGKTVLTTSSDNTAKVWDRSNGSILLNLTDHKNRVTIGMYSPDGSLILTGSDDGTVKIWDSNNGKLLETLVGHQDGVYSVDFSPQGKHIVSSSMTSVFIWEISTGKLVRTLNHSELLKSAIFSPNGQYVLSYSFDNSALLWDMLTEEPIYTFQHKDEITGAKFSSDGSRILTTSIDGTLNIWNTSNGEPILTKKNDDKIYNSDLSPDGGTIVTYNNEYIILRNSNGELLAELTGHKSYITSFEVSRNNEYILTTSFDKTIKIWSLKTGDLLQTLVGHNDLIQSASFSQDSKFVVSASDDKTAKIWQVSSGHIYQDLKGRTTEIISASFLNQENSILINHKEIIVFYDFYSGNKLQASKNKYTTTDVSSDGKQLVTSNGPQLKIWDLASKKFIRSIDAHKYNINSAVYNPAGDKILTGSVDHTAKTWNTAGGIQELNLIGHNDEVLTACYNFDGSMILTGSMDNSAKLWRSIDGQLLHTFKGHETGVVSTVFSPDGGKILTASYDGTVKLWSTLNFKELETAKLSSRGLYSAEFSPDGNSIIVSLADGIGAIINNNKVIKLQGHNGKVISSEYSTDGKTIITGSKDGSFILWNADSGEQLIQHFIFDSDPNLWVHLHPSGLFDASPEAMELMYWTKGLEVIEFAQLKDRYWLPGLWEKVMKGEPLPDVRNMSELKLQPEVSFGELKNGKLPIVLTKRDGGYGKVSIFINGKEVLADARGDDLDSSKQQQTINYNLTDHPFLTNGVNKIEVKASSADGFVEGRSSLFELIQEEKEQEKPHFYGITIGVSQYANTRINLNYPDKDAKAMAKALELGANALFGSEKTHFYSITSTGTTRPNKENIRAIFGEIAEQATANDVIVIYLSGHGITYGGDEGDFYFLTADATAANKEAFNDPVLRKNVGISTSEFVEWLKEIAALKQVMVIDACGSGKAVENLLAARDIDASKIKAIDKMKDRTGMFIISGSAADAASYEANRYGQGLLTYSILQGMKGAALDQEQFYDVQKIFNYALETVPELAEGVGGIQRPQVLIPKGGSFAVGLVDEEARKQIPLNTIKPVFVRSTFVDAQKFNDHLQFSKSMDEELSSVTVRGSSEKYIFLDSREFPEAYSLSGGYTILTNGIELILNINGPIPSQHKLNAANTEELKAKIVELIHQLDLK